MRALQPLRLGACIAPAARAVETFSLRPPEQEPAAAGRPEPIQQ